MTATTTEKRVVNSPMVSILEMWFRYVNVVLDLFDKDGEMVSPQICQAVVMVVGGGIFEAMGR